MSPWDPGFRDFLATCVKAPFRRLRSWSAPRHGGSNFAAVEVSPLQAKDEWPLSMPLFSFAPGEHFLLADAFRNCQVWGNTGSGKTDGPVYLISRAYLAAGFGMIFFTVKPDDPAMYLRWAEETGRGDDVVLIGPKHATTFSFMKEVAQGGAGLVGNLTALLMTLSSMATRGGEGGERNSGRFWQLMDQSLISHSALVLVLAGEPVTTINLERVITSMPTSRAQVGEESWNTTSYVYRTLKQAEDRAGCDADMEDVSRLASYFLKSMAELHPETRGTVQSSVLAILDMFNARDARRLLSSAEPTFDMSMLQDGKILIIDMPVMDNGPVAQLIQKVLKFCAQLSQNRRDVSLKPRPVAFIADESQALVDLQHDAQFFCTSRATRTATVYSTQSLSNYLGEHGGSSVEARVHAMVSNLQTQIFCQTTDTKTVEYAQKLFGKRKQLLMNANTQRKSDQWVMGALGMDDGSSCTAGFSEQIHYFIEADDLHDLAKGGPPDWTIEGLAYMAGKTFRSSRKPFLPVRFRQRPNTA